jgi:hypothetical protein
MTKNGASSWCEAICLERVEETVVNIMSLLIGVMALYMVL